MLLDHGAWATMGRVCTEWYEAGQGDTPALAPTWLHPRTAAILTRQVSWIKCRDWITRIEVPDDVHPDEAPPLALLFAALPRLRLMGGGDRAVISIATPLTRLRHLTLAGCQGLTDHGVASLSVLTTLTYLDISFCRDVTDAGVVSLAASLPVLQVLDLGSCEEVTDAGVTSLSALTSLTHLNLSFLDWMTDVGLRSVASLSRLARLELMWCARVTAVGVASLSALTALRHLDVRDCKQVAPFRATLASSLPNTHILS
jgi:hypothetical protein